MEQISQEPLLYGTVTARVRRMLEPVAHDSFLFYQDTLGILQKELSGKGKVLDAGCGRGTFTASIAEMGHEVVAIDSSEDHLRHTADLIKQQHLEERVRVEISKLPDSFPTDRFDVILDCFSWWHISDWGRLLTLSRNSLNPRGRMVILDTFFGWKTSLEFRQQMRERWHTALPTLNECRNMLIKREFQVLKSDSVQDGYIRYLDSICEKIREYEKEDLGATEPKDLQDVKGMWEWFRNAARAEELVAMLIVADLTQG